MIITARNSMTHPKENYFSINTDRIKALWEQMKSGATNQAKIYLIKEIRDMAGVIEGNRVLGLKEAKDKVESCNSADEMVAAFMEYSQQLPDQVSIAKAEVVGKIIMNLEDKIRDARTLADERRLELERLEGEIDGMERALNIVKNNP